MKNNIIKLGILCALGVSAISGCIIARKTNTPISEEVSAATNLTTYYADADTSSKLDLISSLKTITSKGYKSIAYSSLKNNAYPTTEATTGSYICDYYQKKYNYTISDAGASANAVGQGWNKEHTIPQSYWGGGTDSNTQGCDCIIVLPTDIKCNSTRASYPYGETNAAPFSSDSDCKLGTSSFSGYTGRVFEPLDEYKGDLARIYLYAICRWEGYKFTQGEGNISFSGSLSTNYGLTTYMLNLLKKWHENDPVSDWEKTHNDRVQTVQGNRNPFIDHPEWADWIWFGGSLETKALSSISKSGTPNKTTYTAGESFDPTGLTITAYYDNSTNANVTSSVTWTPNPLTQGTTSVTGTYTYNGVSKTITVSGLTVTAPAPKTLDHISISGQKTSYKIGDSFVKPIVTAHYSDNTTANVTNSATFSGYDLTSAGSQTVTVSYQDKTTTYNITVADNSTETGNYTLITSTSDLVDGSSVVIACNSEGKTATNISSSVMGEVDSTFSKDKNEIASLGDGTIEFTLVKNSTKWGLHSTYGYLGIKSVKNLEWKDTEYYLNISISSGTATICDDNSTNGTLQYNSNSPRFTTYTSTQNSIQLYVKNSSGGGETTLLESIEVIEPKVSYKVGDTFVKPTVMANYDDGTSIEVTDDATFSGYDMSAAGTYTVTITYGGKTTTYSITVSAPAFEHGKSANDPLTVAEAIEKGIAGDTEEYYISCVLTSIKTAWSSTYKNISYWADDVGNASDKSFQIFRIGFNSNPNYEMGTTLIVYSEIMWYESGDCFETSANPLLIEVITVQEKATAYAEGFNDANVCGTDNNTSAIASKWAEQSSAYTALDSFTRSYLTNATASEENNAIKECLNRYDRVIELHGEDATHFPNYMNRVTSSNSRMIEITSKDSLLFITMILLIGATFTYSVITFRKKKIQ